MVKVQVRQGVFETNSSSVHSITLVLESEYDAWVRGELLLHYGRGSEFIKAEDLPKKVVEWEKKHGCAHPTQETLSKFDSFYALEDHYVTYETFESVSENQWEYETYCRRSTREDSEKGTIGIVAFGHYGNNY